MEYWLKAFKRYTWSTITKPFFWESEVNLETLQNLFSHIGVTCKLILGSVRNLS